MKLKLKIIIASVREQRRGPIVAEWFIQKAKEDSRFEIEVLDLKTIDLPLMNEPEHPRKQKYQFDYTKKWSAKITEADVFVFVTPEYNYGSPPSLKNAMDYLSVEWKRKAVGFVSYGGVSGGTRSVEHLKGPIVAHEMMPLPQAVNIPFFNEYINDDDKFEANDKINEGAENLLKNLSEWGIALKNLRESTEK